MSTTKQPKIFSSQFRLCLFQVYQKEFLLRKLQEKKSVLIAQLTRVKIAFTMWISELCLNLI